MASVAAPTKTVTFTRTIQAPLAQVYKAFTDQDWFTDWFCDHADVRAAEGGHLLLAWYTGYHAFGVYKKLEENQQVVFSWRGAGEDKDSEITVQLAEENGQTALTLTLEGYNPEAESVITHEWNKGLDNLVHALEKGGDLRIENRVILGIIPDQPAKETAEKLGLKEGEGTRIVNIIPGRGAEKAGLLAEDIVVEVDGHKITNTMPINVALGAKKPGDQANVVYYRDGEKQALTLTLSGYPLPKQVRTFTELAGVIEERYGELEHELHEMMNSASEAEAAQRPAAEEWSANEVIAHLILSERYVHHSIGTLLQGPETQGYTCNAPARIAGVTKTFPGKNALLNELHRCFEETVIILREFPDKDAERRTSVWWTNFMLDGMITHTRNHLTQIRAALESARK